VIGAPALPTPAQLREAFLWSEWRTVTKTATVGMHGNSYEVDAALVGRKVELVFDPLCETSRNGSYVQLRIMWPGGPRSVGTGRSSRVRIRIIQRHSPVRNASSGSAGL